MEEAEIKRINKELANIRSKFKGKNNLYQIGKKDFLRKLGSMCLFCQFDM
jgi:hypothetical protein